tara:strand:+ start:300 stop:1247 length:948 start_codon:yes stop_codon:yes gene_type:complete
MADEFKFPDEAENKKVTTEAVDAPDVEVEIVDDTPAADRNRDPLPQEIVEELEKDDLEEYSDKVKKRLGQMKKVWHDERRAKESATREREEALKFAHLRERENKELKQRLGVGEKLFVEEVTKSTNAELIAVKERLKQAYEAGDAEAITEAQEQLTDVKLKLQRVQDHKPALQETNNSVEHVTEQVQAQPQVDQKAEKWRQKNTWFGADEEMTALALGLHEKLVRSGVDPRSDDYYRRVDENMKKRFPENFEEEPNRTEATDRPRKAANVVAPATRSTAPTKVRLTPTAAALAKKMGITPEAYAKEMIKLGNYNG